jgi:carbon-monoxide dehydrogenase large subunit
VGIDAPDGVDLFTADDLADVAPIRPMLHRESFVAMAQPVLARNEVRFAGEPVAVVVARSQYEAEDAARSVNLEIEPTEPVIGLEEALGDRARVHHETESNVVIDAAIGNPDADDAFTQAAHVIEVTVQSGRENASPIEPRGAYAVVEGHTGRTVLYASTQDPHVLRTALADSLGVPESTLRVIAPNVGGGFGQKQCLPPEYIVITWLARHLRQAVAWIEDRTENLMASFHSRDQVIRGRGAFDEDGRFLAVEAEILCNVGAYSCYPVTHGVEPLMALAEFSGPYVVPVYRARARGVTTNTCPMAPYRGVSRPVITLAMERLVDEAARRIGIDPLELRRRNLISKFPHRSPTGITYDEGSYVAAMDMAAAAVDITTFRNDQKLALAEGRFLGVGFSTFSERTGYGTPTFAARSMEITPGYETVDISVDPSGYVTARLGTSPHGQGLETSLAQVIADELGTFPENVRIIAGDTDETPYGWGTFASRSMVLSGGASKLAASKLRTKIAGIAADMLEAAPEDIVLQDGEAQVMGSGVAVGIDQVARRAYHQAHLLGEGVDPGLYASATYDPEGTFSNACHAAIVEVEPATGQVRIHRYVIAEDAGVLINPMIVDGQIHGGVAQGIASALYEELVYDEDGNLLTSSFMDYLLPTSAEVPQFEIHHLETPTENTITGAKGLGEGGTIGAPAAILNAISDALAPLEVALNETPATPERIREAIRSVERATT